MAGESLINFFSEFVNTEPKLNYFHIGNDGYKNTVLRQIDIASNYVDIIEDFSQLRRVIKLGLPYRGFIAADHPKLLQFIKLTSELSNNVRLFLYGNRAHCNIRPLNKFRFIQLSYHHDGLYVFKVFLRYLCLNNNLKVDLSDIHGLGLFAFEGLKSGDVLFNLFGDVIDFTQNEKFDFSGEWNILDGKRLLKRPIWTSYGFINHSRDPNCKINLDRINVEAIRDIPPEEEILLDYRREILPNKYILEHGSSYL